METAGGAETLPMLVSHVCRIRIRRDLSCRGKGLPSPEHQLSEEESPQHLVVTISGDSPQVSQKVAGNPGIRLKGLHTDSTHPGPSIVPHHLAP